MKTLKWILLLGLNVFLVLSLLHPKVAMAPPQTDYLDKEVVYQMINQYRKDNGVKPLVESTLCEYAQERSGEIITDWSHDQFMKDGEINGKKFTTVCPECENTGENLAREAIYNKQLITSWQHSPGHNAALIDPRWEIMCIGISWEKGKSYIALEFGDIDD